MLVKDGRVYASLHGKAADRTVTFIRNIDSLVPFHERVSEDPKLPSGLRVLAQRGVPGFKITRHRVVLDETTKVAVRERTQDSYPPTTQLWLVGKGGPAPADYVRPKNDAHPEYVADQYLQMTQTPERGTVDVAREPGRTGLYGWIEREQMVVR